MIYLASDRIYYMKKAFQERNVVVVLFILVLVVFSFAQRDTKKIARLYQNPPAVVQLEKPGAPTAEVRLAPSVIRN